MEVYTFWPSSFNSPTPQNPPLVTTNMISFSRIFLKILHIREIKQLSFPIWHTLLSKMLSSSINISFYSWLIFHCIHIYHKFFIHFFINGHFGCFHVLSIVNTYLLLCTSFSGLLWVFFFFYFCKKYHRILIRIA